MGFVVLLGQFIYNEDKMGKIKFEVFTKAVRMIKSKSYAIGNKNVGKEKKMRKVLKYIERTIQILTFISSVVTTIEVIKAYKYRKQLKKKADLYLDDELELEGNIRGEVRVYSPTLENKEEKAKKLILITGIGVILSFILNLINREY